MCQFQKFASSVVCSCIIYQGIDSYHTYSSFCSDTTNAFQGSWLNEASKTITPKSKPHTQNMVVENFMTLKQACSSEYQGAQDAFKDSMIHWILQFTLLIAFRCVLHRCESQEIRCWKLYICYSKYSIHSITLWKCVSIDLENTRWSWLCSNSSIYLKQ